MNTTLINESISQAQTTATVIFGSIGSVAELGIIVAIVLIIAALIGAGFTAFRYLFH